MIWCLKLWFDSLAYDAPVEGPIDDGGVVGGQAGGGHDLVAVVQMCQLITAGHSSRQAVGGERSQLRTNPDSNKNIDFFSA